MIFMGFMKGTLMDDISVWKLKRAMRSNNKTHNTGLYTTVIIPAVICGVLLIGIIIALLVI